MLDQEKLRAKSKWNSVADIPDFPFESFDQLKEAVNDGTYSVGVDRGRARELYSLVGPSFAAQLIIEQMHAIVVWITLASIGGALVLRNLWLLLGIPLALLFFWLATALHFRGSSLGWLLACLGIIGIIWGFSRGSRVPSCLLATAVIPLVTVGVVYSVSVKTARSAILKSEPLFLFLFERFACTLRDNTTGRTYSHLPLRTDR